MPIRQAYALSHTTSNEFFSNLFLTRWDDADYDLCLELLAVYDCNYLDVMAPDLKPINFVQRTLPINATVRSSVNLEYLDEFERYTELYSENIKTEERLGNDLFYQGVTGQTLPSERDTVRVGEASYLIKHKSHSQIHKVIANRANMRGGRMTYKGFRLSTVSETARINRALSRFNDKLCFIFEIHDIVYNATYVKRTPMRKCRQHTLRYMTRLAGAQKYLVRTNTHNGATTYSVLPTDPTISYAYDGYPGFKLAKVDVSNLLDVILRLYSPLRNKYFLITTLDRSSQVIKAVQLGKDRVYAIRQGEVYYRGTNLQIMYPISIRFSPQLPEDDVAVETGVEMAADEPTDARTTSVEPAPAVTVGTSVMAANNSCYDDWGTLNIRYSHSKVIECLHGDLFHVFRTCEKQDEHIRQSSWAVGLKESGLKPFVVQRYDYGCLVELSKDNKLAWAYSCSEMVLSEPCSIRMTEPDLELTCCSDTTKTNVVMPGPVEDCNTDSFTTVDVGSLQQSILKVYPVNLCGGSNCQINIHTTYQSINIEFQALDTVHWTLAVSEGLQTGILNKHSKMTKYITVGKEGQVRFTASCGGKTIRKNYVLSRDEICRRGGSYLPIGWSYYYCMHPGQIHIIATLVFTAVFIHLLRTMSGFFLYLFTAFIFTILRVPFQIMGCKCRNCGRVKCYGHRCPDSCDCGATLMRVGGNHAQSCEHRTSFMRSLGSWFEIKSLDRGSRVCSRYGVGCVHLVILFVIITLLSNVAMGQEMNEDSANDELTHHIDALITDGFTAYKGLMRNRGERLPIGLVSEKETCRADRCTLSGVIQTSLQFRPDFQAGYTLTSKKYSDKVEFDIRVHNTYMYANLVKQYDAFPVTHKGATRHECTEDCKKCFNNLGAPNVPRSNVSYVKDSSWSCAKFGCFALDTGCTCGSCWLEDRRTGPRFEVFKAGKFTTVGEICFVINNVGYCKNITADEGVVSKQHKITLNENPDTFGNKYVIAWDGKHFLGGSINPRGDFSSRFATVQSQNGVPTCQWSKENQRVCKSFHAPYIRFERCCIDTYDYHKELVPLLDHIREGEKLMIEGKTIGAGSAVITAENILFKENIKKMDVTDFSIHGCTGCYGCSAGMTFTAHVKSSVVGRTVITCDSVDIRQNGIEVSRREGVDITLVGLANNADFVLSCTVKERKATTHCVLTSGPKSYHDTGLLGSLDISSSCGLSCWFRDTFKSKGIWKKVLSALFSFLLFCLFMLAIIIICRSRAAIVNTYQKVKIDGRNKTK